MAGYNPDDYELVEVRLERFWKDNPDGKIKTKLIESSENGQMVICHAEVYEHKEDTEPKATGIAQEYQDDKSFANRTSWMEVCETSAIGRALANWKYQGSKKARPSQEEMSKVAKQPPTKKAEQLETGKQTSKITESALKSLVLAYCNDDKNFARECYSTTMKRFTISNKVTNDVSSWDETLINKFLELIDLYVKKFKDDFEKQAGNTQEINNALSILDAVEKESEDNVGEIKEGPWMQEPISDGQKNFIESLITQAIDSKLDELAAEAKQYLASGEATKGNASQMIDKLKDALS
tara:strand:+ start:147 stop:1031 length:885 start_codon:yes stop_codon:yes gene_type:complete